jgi:hypothetical protein
MKTNLLRRAGMTLAATMALATVTLANPLAAFAADANHKTMHAGKHHDIEAHIKRMHDQLKITAAQEPQWTSVAQVMRDNAKAMTDAMRDRVHNVSSMNAVDDINSYQAITAAHADGLKNLSAAFAPLYAAMSPDQQKNADAVFGHKIAKHKHA